CLLAGPDQADEYGCEYLREGGKTLGHHLAALDVFQYRGQDFPEAGILGSIAQVAQTFDERNSRTRYLLQIKAESDEVATGDTTFGERWGACTHCSKGDEIET